MGRVIECRIPDSQIAGMHYDRGKFYILKFTIIIINSSIIITIKTVGNSYYYKLK